MTDPTKLRDELATLLCMKEDSGSWLDDDSCCSWHFQLADAIMPRVLQKIVNAKVEILETLDSGLDTVVLTETPDYEGVRFIVSRQIKLLTRSTQEDASICPDCLDEMDYVGTPDGTGEYLHCWGCHSRDQK